ncbi:MAG TPA: hypothetical protein VJK03_04050 [Candidatus Nanoarchaeia archaeon]|nr:hypothetical protein [Candidatus Nanoarchaeia archaeon]
MKRSLFIFLSAVLFILSIYFLANVFLQWMSYERSSVPVRFTVSKVTGIDVDPSALSFGHIVPGNSVTRELLLSNNRNLSIEARIAASHSVARYLSFEPLIVVPPQEQRRIGIVAYVPPETKYGNYTGFVTIRIRGR